MGEKMSQFLACVGCSDRVPEAGTTDELCSSQLCRLDLRLRCCQAWLFRNTAPLPRYRLEHQEERAPHPVVGKIRGHRQAPYGKCFCKETISFWGLTQPAPEGHTLTVTLQTVQAWIWVAPETPRCSHSFPGVLVQGVCLLLWPGLVYFFLTLLNQIDGASSHTN